MVGLTSLYSSKGIYWMIFEDPRTAKEVARCFKVFFRVKEGWRRMNGRESFQQYSLISRNG